VKRKTDPTKLYVDICYVMLCYVLLNPSACNASYSQGEAVKVLFLSLSSSHWYRGSCRL